MKNSRSLFFVVLLLFPLLFIHINHAHDWGDDFSAFIAQAQAIIEGKNYYQTGFVPNAEKPDLVASPIGWSLLLLPVVAIFGTDMMALKIYVSAFFILWAIALYLIFENRKHGLFTLLLIPFLFYHPQFVCFKSEILSDAAFAACFSFSLLLIGKEKVTNKKGVLLLGVLMGLSCLIRPLGFVLFGAVLFEYFRRKEWYKYSMLLSAVVALLLYLIIEKVLFPCSNSYSHYTHFLGKAVGQNIVENARFYFLQWQNYWAMLSDNQTTSAILSYLFSFLIILSALRYLLCWNVYSVTVLAYLMVVMVWPFRSQGFRYIYPVLPFLVYASFESLNRMVQVNRKATVWVSSLLLLFLLVKCFAFNYQPYQATIAQYGSQTVAANEMYTYLAKHVPAHSRVVFTKPRVLCLYSHVEALYPMGNTDFQQMKIAYTNYQTQYFVRTNNTSLECFNGMYSSYLDSMEKQKVLVWSNNDFEVYKRNP